jgi:DNA polymerase III gamma/tau subunit
MADGDEAITCSTCRQVMGLLPLKDLFDASQRRATGDFIDILHFLRQLADKDPGATFQSVLSAVLEQVYCNTGKWYDPDLEEVHNDEFLDALQDLLGREHP